MKNLPAALLSFLQTNNSYGRADLFSITLGNGQVIRATNCQTDISYGGNFYYSSLYGSWERGSITTEVSFDLKAGDMDLDVFAPSSVLFPGTSISLMQCVTAGLFDGAAVRVYTAYWAAGAIPNTLLGVETKFVGQIMNFKPTGRSKAKFSVADMLYLLNIKMPSRLIQSGCRHTLYDDNCTMNRASFSAARTVAAGSTTKTINLNSAVTASVFAQGFILFTSGQNNGLVLAIKSQPSTTQIVLAGVTPLFLTIGDAFTMYYGCDKSQSTCKNIFNNLINFGGFPFVPNPEYAA